MNMPPATALAYRAIRKPSRWAGARRLSLSAESSVVGVASATVADRGDERKERLRMLAAENTRRRHRPALIGEIAAATGVEPSLDDVLRTGGIDGPRIFRVARWHLWPVVTSEIALEQIGATGMRYTPLLTSP